MCFIWLGYLICAYHFILLTTSLFHIGDPSSDPNATGDPFRTLFVGRIVSDMYFLYLKRLLNSQDASYLACFAVV